MHDAPQPLLIAVAGSEGRMGRTVLSLLADRPSLQLAAAFDRAQTAELDAALDAAQVVIDFTTAESSAALAKRAAERGDPALVIGSTGFDADQDARVRKAAERVAIVRSGNFSLGVNLLLGLVEQAARALPAGDYDVEVLEAHHRRKVDAPSGTALMLGEAAARGRGGLLSDLAVRGRDGLTGPREEGSVGFAVLRGGGVVGEHSVMLAAEDEIITLSHSARDRALFARGALTAAHWVARRPPGLYAMSDVLGFNPAP